MTEDINKIGKLLNSYEALVQSFDCDKEALAIAIAAISVYNIELSFELWERMLVELEDTTRGNRKSLVKKRKPNYFKININKFSLTQKEGDDFNHYLCTMTYNKLKDFHDKVTIFENISKHNILIEKLFSKENVINYFHTDLLVFLFNHKTEVATNLLLKLYDMKKGRATFSATRAEAIGFILRGIEVSVWELVRLRIYKLICDLNISDPTNRIQHAYYMLMKSRVDASDITMNFVHSVSKEDYENGDYAFQCALRSQDFDFDIDYFIYRVIQNIKIDDWMKCDEYIYELLRKHFKQPFSDQITKAIVKKQKLKNTRLEKAKKV